LKRVRFQDRTKSSDLTGPASEDLFKGTL